MIHVPAPIRSAPGGANTNTTRRAGSPEPGGQFDAPAILQLQAGMDALQLQQARTSRPANREMPGQGRSPLRSGPTNVTVQVETRSGRNAAGILRNQPIVLDSLAGRLVIPLHQIRRLQFHEDKKRVSAECHNGDLAEGILINAHFDLQTYEGAGRRLPARHLERLHVEEPPALDTE